MIAPSYAAIPVEIPAAPAAILLPGFLGTTLPDWLAARLRAGLAGVCLFGQNIASPAQLRRLTAEIRAANPHAVIAIDEEGGDVTRLHDRLGSGASMTRSTPRRWRQPSAGSCAERAVPSTSRRMSILIPTRTTP